MTTTNVVGEQYRVRINGERSATFDSIEEAAAYFSAYACEHCYRCTRPDHDEADCCGIETWLVE